MSWRRRHNLQAAKSCCGSCWVKFATFVKDSLPVAAMTTATSTTGEQRAADSDSGCWMKIKATAMNLCRLWWRRNWQAAIYGANERPDKGKTIVAQSKTKLSNAEYFEYRTTARHETITLCFYVCIYMCVCLCAGAAAKEIAKLFRIRKVSNVKCMKVNAAFLRSLWLRVLCRQWWRVDGDAFMTFAGTQSAQQCEMVVKRISNI